jgi:hypothetical protein
MIPIPSDAAEWADTIERNVTAKDQTISVEHSCQSVRTRIALGMETMCAQAISIPSPHQVEESPLELRKHN